MQRRLFVVGALFLSCVFVVGQEPHSEKLLMPFLTHQNLVNESTSATKLAQVYVGATVERLLSDFDARLSNPDQYRDFVFKECGTFPEGTIYGFAIPAFAYANMAFANPRMKLRARKQMETLIDLAIPVVVHKVRPPQRDLTQLTTYQNEATYLGTLYLMLAHYAKIGGDSRYEALHTHLANLFYQALVESQGESLHSYPEYTWHFDTLFVLTALDLDDLRTGNHRARVLIDKHLQWKARNATHVGTGLPVAVPQSLPRGCDLSLQIALLSQLAPDTATVLYGHYVHAHWIDNGLLAGFSEWPIGIRPAGPLGGDVDSGPVIMGIGLTGTGFAFATTRAMKDSVRYQRLVSELQMVTPLIQALANTTTDNEMKKWFSEYAPLKPSYFTGFLYGDAMMFYALTWTPYRGNNP